MEEKRNHFSRHFRSMFLNTSLKHFYFVDTDTSTTVAH